MPTIIRRKSADGDPSFQVRIRLRGHPPQSATFARKTDAKIWAAQTEAAIRDGRYFEKAEAGKHAIGDLVDRYIEDILPSKRDQRSPRRQLLWWKKKFGHLSLKEVTPAVLSEARDKLANTRNRYDAPLSPSTVNRYMAALSHAFTMAVKEWQWCSENPFFKVRKNKEPRGRVRYLTDEERECLLKACRESGHPHLYTAVVLALSTGARKGELMNLRWPDVDLKQDRITLFETKNNEVRVLPLAGHALELIKEKLRNRIVGVEWVFPGQGNRKPIDLQMPWVKALRKAEIEDFRWHDLRHSAASYLAMNGASLAEISEILGHRQLGMVKRYAHLSPQHTAKVVASMNAKIFGPR